MDKETETTPMSLGFRVYGGNEGMEKQMATTIGFRV